jgi:hypothetical protein
MRATPRWLAIIAWMNVVVGAIDGWRYLPGLLLAAGHWRIPRKAPALRHWPCSGATR